MSSTLNYILKFRSDADKVTASVFKLDKGLNGVQDRIKKLSTKFSSGIDKINSKLGGLRLNSFIQNIQFASQGLDSLNAPGLKLNG